MNRLIKFQSPTEAGITGWTFEKPSDVLAERPFNGKLAPGM